MKDKSALRTKLLSARAFKSVIVKDDDGTEYEVRQPSIRQRAEIRKATSNVAEDGTISFEPFEFMLRAAMACTYVPGTNDLIFTDEDFDVLLGMPAGSIVDELSDVAAKMCNVEGKESKKPSSGMEKDNSSS